jgi:galactokinase
MPLDHAALRADFAARFAGSPRLFRAPGRVNLIGEHTDYNDGYVLPAAMDREVCFCVAPRPDRTVHLHALNLDAEESCSLDDLLWEQRAHWTNYIKSMAAVLERNGFRCGGFEGVIRGDLPIGGGVSSSSAFTAAAATTFTKLSGLDVDETRLIQLILEAENGATGLRGGIMDQYTARRGKRDHALLIDCRTLEHRLVTLPPMTLVVADSKKDRSLATSGYNDRRGECEVGARVVRGRYPWVRALRDCSREMLEACRMDLGDLVYRRCRHVVEENARVHESISALARGDLHAFGLLLNLSHVSLRDDYEVSCPELNALTEIAWGVDGVFGARLVGAGFGGCVLAACKAEAVGALQERIAAEYPRRCPGYVAEVYATRAGDGAGEVV